MPCHKHEGQEMQVPGRLEQRMEPPKGLFLGQRGGAGSGAPDLEEGKKGKVCPKVLGEELVALALHPQPCAWEG